MAKTIYTPNRLLDIALASTLLVEFGFVIHYFYKEWKNFWFFSLSFVIIAVAVRLTEKAFYHSGKWLSSRFLSSEPYNDPLSKSYSMMKYTDQAWQLVYHTVFAVWEFILLQKYSWFQGRITIPHVNDQVSLPLDIQYVSIYEISLYMYQAYRHVFVNRRKRDYYEMYLHHIATIYLCFFSYRRFYMYGLVVLFIHDSSDILVDGVKMLNLLKLDGPTGFYSLEITFVLLMIIWFYQRLFFFPKFIISNGVKNIAEMYPGEGMLTMVKKEYELCAVLLCLVILYGLHWYWYSIFVKILKKSIVGSSSTVQEATKGEYEGASDSEEEEEEEPVEHKKSE